MVGQVLGLALEIHVHASVFAESPALRVRHLLVDRVLTLLVVRVESALPA
jgi:hypothetical protein